MENKYTFTAQTALETPVAAPTAAPMELPPITDKTTLGELLKMLDLTPGQRKPDKTPTPKKLRTAVEQLANMHDCVLYRNGFVYYNNGCNHTVLWIPYCVSFTYHFNPLKDTEKDYLKQKLELSQGLLETTAWPVVVTMIAEHRIEHHIDTNAGIGYADASDYADEEEEDQGVDNIEFKDKGCGAFRWYDEAIGTDPLKVLIRKEKREKLLKVLTDKQRELFILYYKYGYTQVEIAEITGLSRSTVKQQLKATEKKIKNIFS